MNKKPTFEEFNYILGSFCPVVDTGNIDKHTRGMSFGQKSAQVLKIIHKGSAINHWQDSYEEDKSPKGIKEMKRRMKIAEHIFGLIQSKQPFFTHNKYFEVEIKRISWEKGVLYYGASDNGLKYIESENRKNHTEWLKRQKKSVLTLSEPKFLLPPKNGKLGIKTFINAVLTKNIKIEGIEIDFDSPKIC